MGKLIFRLAVLVLVGMLAMPGAANAQLGAVPQPSPPIPWPIGRPHLEQGGFYFAGEFMYWKQSNPLKSQVIARRGLVDTDGSIAPNLGLPSIPGQFIGSGNVALDVRSVSGPTDFQPGFNFTLGYRFESGTAMEMTLDSLVRCSLFSHGGSVAADCHWNLF